MSPSLVRRCGAEFAGTFVLVFAGTGAIVFDERHEAGLGSLGVAVAFGLAIGVMVYATRHVSGAHFNPAISVALATIGRFERREVPVYVGVQLGAAACASGLLRLLAGNVAQLGATVPSVTTGEAVVIEIALTVVLAFVIATIALRGEPSAAGAATAIGGAVVLGSLVGGAVTGGSMNPARSFGPALAALAFAGHWVYWVGPVAGGLVGALVARALATGAIVGAGRT